MYMSHVEQATVTVTVGSSNFKVYLQDNTD
jgi:hypothetical protein